MVQMQTDLERRFNDAMVNIYKRAKSETGYNAIRFLSMVVDRGGILTARHLINSSNVSEGYEALWGIKRLDLSVEALVLQPEWASLFSEDERSIARNRLNDYGHKTP